MPLNISIEYIEILDQIFRMFPRPAPSMPTHSGLGHVHEPPSPYPIMFLLVSYFLLDRFVDGKEKKEETVFREAMVGGALARASAFRVGLGVSGATIVSGSCACPSHLWISHVLTSSSSLGISCLFCRVTQCM
jgi:hypothetical protein